MSLRAELIGETVSEPSFAVLLPTGWEAHTPDFASVDERVDAAVAALPVASRGAVLATLRETVASARAEATRADIIRVFSPSQAGEDDAIPVSLVASWLIAPAGATASDLGATMVQRYRARPLDERGTILKWSAAKTSTIEGAEVRTAGHGYLIRVPDEQKRALVFRSTILQRVDGTEIPDDGIDAMELVCDAIVASVRWRKRA
ncbi:hypothetical protein C1N74_02345 [Microbacterium sp. SGAir0570]|uniref:hypothetical protein n=1 Tax=Microbacterium sp. SGAir0570 TaxID=2070348 RepID=UPI0010CCFE7F|nr:hypothetical protein [Microbacterium sp. SGAir0570]QCR39384.1 hypothetical protein C1N74_02345 [Microbacterium sp. SGAir0570]